MLSEGGSGLQVYLKQYFELFSVFDDIDTGSGSSLCFCGSVSLTLSILPARLMVLLHCAVCHRRRDDKRVDLPEFKKALPLLVRWEQVEAGCFDCTRQLTKCTSGELA